MTMAAAADGVRARGMTGEEKKVIFASSLGTVFEWYDFYLYGWTAAQIGKAFYSAFDANTQFIFALLTFSAGFLVRPLGALVFGRVGDLVGRKYTFLVTITIMGMSTFLVGLTPGYQTIGWLAPTILIGLRLLQGLALGGEYGGAATYVAEHAPQGRRGFYTSWIQTTATIGLFMSLLVVYIVRNSMSPEAFADSGLSGGWRYPYLLSIVLLGISIWIRMQLSESPLFQKMKDEGKGSKAPLSEAFGNWQNGKYALIALLGLTAGQAVIWYGGQFYARIFLVNTLKVPANSADIALIIALAIATVGFLFFGWLSDKIGRKPIIMAGCLLGALTYHFAFSLLTSAANPALEKALASAPVTVVADPKDCNVLFDPVGGRVFTSSCDVARNALIASSVNFKLEPAAAGSVAKVVVGSKSFDSVSGNGVDPKAFAAARTAFTGAVTAAVGEAGYPVKGADPAAINMPMLILVLTYLAILVTMVYGPIAAALVELFPTRIRYTSMSLPYHIGNGWFGGLLPPIAVALVAATGNIYAGLWYPIAIASMTFIVGLIFVPETKDVDITKT
ncbi:sugar phosphate permease [Bradyrhizobium sp. YR681]|uniref:MFS transporter n=1 Tax=Bradyrhizobium sp. YR681 TaxID=1144344 RepID=UPI00026F5A42|nr:MFS transporter [Bradyrhizobium sp. YR681]EJN10937.1 sugar phosphate permease [Bradyrhizobium sp. YR681]